MAAAPSRGPTYKVVLLGELGVGKTSLFRRLKDNSFDEYRTSTTGIDSCSKVITCDGKTTMVSLSSTLPYRHASIVDLLCVFLI